MTKICRQCEAIMTNSHWVYDDIAVSTAKRTHRFEYATCTGCERLAKKRVDGIVTLRSPLLDAHRGDAMNLIHNVAERSHTTNVAARIAGIDERKGQITVTTTDRHLAERIGKEFEKAYSGRLDIKWPKGEEFVRVVWERH